jgi:hypothetical protein
MTDVAGSPVVPAFYPDITVHPLPLAVLLSIGALERVRGSFVYLPRLQVVRP